MRLASIFLANVPKDRRAGFAAGQDLEAALSRLVEEGQRAWPEIPLKIEDFLAFLGRSLPADAAPGLASLRAGDLYLVCAYCFGAPGASRTIDERYMTRVAAALRRIGTDASTVADIQQELRRRLLEVTAPQPDLKPYSGRGDLVAWLCVTAVRQAGRRRDRGKRETPLEESGAALFASAGEDPELSCLRETYRREFQEAFQEALASLTSRERNVLRCHFIKGLSIDQIGALYGVHRATAARWIHRAREALCLRTRELLAQRVSLSQGGFTRMLSLIDSQISVRLAIATA